MSEPNTDFLQVTDAWRHGLGGVRDVVRQQVMAGQLGGLGLAAGARVLDIGCGQGTQALALAKAGHEVVGLDIAADLLAEFDAALRGQPAEVRARVTLVEGPGESALALVGGGFDLVLCHGLLMYFAEPSDLLQAIADVTADDGRVSFLVRNGLAPAMRPGLMGDFALASASFDSLDYVNRMGLHAHAHTPDIVDALVGPHGFARVDWFGVRVFLDHLEGAPPVGADLEAMIAAEAEAGRRDPYRQVAALLHLVYRRGA